MPSPPTTTADATRPSGNDKEVDVDADADMEMKDVDADAPTAGSPTNAGASNDTDAPNSGTTLTADTTQTQTQTQTSALPPQQSRKDVTLREFLSKMDDYAPIIPDAVTAHYLTLAGLPPPSSADPSGASTGTTPLPLARLLALATQKFVADIAADAYQYSRIRASNTSAASNVLGATGIPLPGGVGTGAAAGVGGAGGGVGGPGGAGKAGQNAALGVQRAGFGGGGTGGTGQGKTVLTMEDLGMAVQEYGVNVKRGEFYR